MIGGRKIGFMPSGSYSGMSVERVCESLKGIGYDAVEWHLGFASPRERSAGELERLVKVTHSFGLEISEVVVQQDLVVVDETKRRDTTAFILECIDAYAGLGIDTVNLFTGPVPWGSRPLVVGSGISESKAWGMLFEAFDQLVAAAEKARMNLALENVWGMLCHDFFTAKFLIDHYKSPWFGVNYDPSHDILAGHSDVGWIVRQWGGNVKHVHLKDAAGTAAGGKFLFPLPGEGNVDWTNFAAAIEDIGYKGVMSVEFESFEYVKRILNGDWEKAARLSYENFSMLLGQ